MKKPTKPTGAGRPRFDDEKMGTGTFRRTIKQAEKLDALGGGAFLRAAIDSTPWPKGSKPK